ncbi:MAG TPA: carbohydrate ABC transporter permease [Trueperaceae bacterium]
MRASLAPSLSGRQRRNTFLLALGLSIGAFLWLFPFVWSLIASLKPADAFFTNVWALPQDPVWDNYLNAYDGLNFLRSFGNSMGVALAVACLQCATGTLAAFAFARMNFPGKEVIFMLFLATLMIPGTVTLTANFLILSKLHWIDTYWALIVPHGASGFSIFLLRQFFKTIPFELEEAARLDGAGRLRFLWSIVLPLSRPALTTVFIFVFIGNYNDFLWPLVMTSSENLRVIQIALSVFTDLEATANYGPLMAAAILTMLPTVVLFAFMQRAFIRGITRSGLK